MLEILTLALTRAARPLRAREIYAVAEQLAGKPLLWTSVKAALAAGAAGEQPRFQRLRRGVYTIDQRAIKGEHSSTSEGVRA